jgi:hypothetical protein
VVPFGPLSSDPETPHEASLHWRGALSIIEAATSFLTF